ncbi:MAG TPA: ABC transporter ATP-binding protein [Kofleriaceae bacterium]|nr:ABC transporter ATP-binding protein [Kofleriaceae bacterium]
MIRLDEVDKRYGATRALDRVSFAVERGEVVGLVGPNGAGKTTALRVLSGFLRPDRGAVWVDGIDAVAHRREAAARIGYLPEGPPLYPELRVEEYLRFRARLKGVARRELGARVDEVLERVSARDRARTMIGRLSRGYRQRVGLADALLGRPDVLLLDEPTSGLDPAQVRDLRALLGELAGDRAVVLSSHALSELEAVAARLVVMAGGRVAGDGRPDQLRARFGLPATASLEEVFLAATAGGER